MGKRKTFKDFIATVENRTIVEFDEFEGKDFCALDYSERYALLKKRAYKISRIIRADNGTFFYGVLITEICRHGRNIHLKNTWRFKCWYKGGRFRMEGANSRDLYSFFEDLGAGWWISRDEWNKYMVLMYKPIIVKAILSGTVYNDETFWRTCAKRCYHIDCGWKLFRDLWCSREVNGCYSFVNILDIRDFTNSFERSAKAIIESEGSRLRLMKDVLDLAVVLNEKVDLSWSDRRLQAHHQKQVSRLNGISLDANSAEPVYTDDEVVEIDGVRMLRSEQDVFAEGLSMSHCLWTNYWKCIQDRRMIAFHLHREGEDSTFSVVRGRDGKPCLDQIHLSHNRSVSADTRQYALTFIGAHSDNIDRVLKQSADTVDDLPF